MGNIDDVAKQGINFKSRRNWDNEQEPDEELHEEPEPEKRGEDVAQLLRQQKLGEKHTRAKVYNATGGAFNLGGLAVLIGGGYNVLVSPDTAIYFELAREHFGFPYTQEQVVAFIDEWKAHLMGAMASFQTFLMWWQSTVKQMKLGDYESVFEAINSQAGKIIKDLNL